MSSTKCRLCEEITKEYFGERLSKLIAFLASNGATTLKEIVFRGKFQRSKAVLDLQVLIQHNFVVFDENVEPKYSANLDFIAQRTRLFSFAEIGRRLYGEGAEILMMEFVKHARIEKKSCIKEIMSKVQVDSEVDFEGKLSETFDKLEQNGLITKLDRNYIYTESEKRRDIGDGGGNDAKKGRKRIREDSSDEDDTKNSEKKQDVYVLHIPKLNQLLAHQHITQAVQLSLGEECSLVMETVLNHSLTPSSHQLTPTQDVSLNELLSILRRTSKMTVSTLEQCLTILTKYEPHFLTKTDERAGGCYRVDFKKAFKHLCIKHVCYCVEEIYGSKAKNIFNIILASIMIEENEIEKKSRDPESVRTVLAKLRKDQYVCTMSFPKTSDYNSLNTIYLYKIDLDRVARLIVERCYKAAFNLISRRSYEVSCNKRLLEIQSKLEVVLSQLEDDEQKEELQRTYISAVEQEALKKLRKNIDMLDNAEVQLDTTTFVMETFLVTSKMTS